MPLYVIIINKILNARRCKLHCFFIEWEMYLQGHKTYWYTRKYWITKCNCLLQFCACLSQIVQLMNKKIIVGYFTLCGINESWLKDTSATRHNHINQMNCPIHWYQNGSWWQMETFSALLALCKRKPLVTGGFPSKASYAELWCLLWCAPEQTMLVDLRNHRARYDVTVMYQPHFAARSI